MDTLIDERALSKLKWRCRRGLLENDLFIERFFARHERQLTESLARALLALMDLSDNDLLDLLLARTEPEGELATPDVMGVLRMMQAPPERPPGRPPERPPIRAALSGSSRRR